MDYGLFVTDPQFQSAMLIIYQMLNRTTQAPASTVNNSVPQSESDEYR